MKIAQGKTLGQRPPPSTPLRSAGLLAGVPNEWFVLVGVVGRLSR